MFLKYNYTHIILKSQGGIKFLVCSICGQYTCAAWCPNNYDGGIFTCSSCGCGICDGEKYYKIEESYFHKKCLINNFCKEELIELFGAAPRVASKTD